ncbi:MAG: hypothetical protein DLM62_09125 [Pseudonocardiales bacterium]|nr:MAG: hypothetical protein DLM62_09125 [Pseudonocardiales bacterium]
MRTADGRTWWVRSSISWTKRAMTDEFEHDMTDFGHGIIMLVILVALTLFVVFWTPADVVRPAWFVLLVLLLLMVLPVSWALQRPWLIKVHTNGPAGGEHWEDVVRGMMPAREKVYQIVDDLKRTGGPEDSNGSLTRVIPTPPSRDS